MINEPLALAIGGVLGAAFKAWMTVSQETFSRRSVADVVIGGLVGLLWTVYPVFQLPEGASLVQKGALVGIVAYTSSDLLSNLARRFGVVGPWADKPPTGTLGAKKPQGP